MGAHPDELIVDRRRFPMDRTGELSGGVAYRLGRLRVNQVDHRLGGAEVHPPVQERAFCKLSRSRLSRPEGKKLPKQHLQEHRRAVALKLHRILPGVALRPAADRTHAEIQQFLFSAPQLSVEQPPILRVLQAFS